MNRLKKLWSGLLISGFVLTGFAALSASDESGAKSAVTPQQAAFFETKIRPLLIANCFSCHSDKQQSGALRLDSRDFLLKGGASGPAIVPGQPDKSRLLQAVRYDGKIKMPPTGKLEPVEIAALTEWVKMGAPWPEDKGVTKSAGTEMVITPEQRAFWSFRPVKKPALPKVKNRAWCQSPIDRFVLAKLEAKGFHPAPPADKRTLIRRAYFDLIGLPPTPEEVNAFVADTSPNAFAKVVDHLLASPRYGERWGRHWLDVARYADSNGLDENLTFGNAYRYRDYVIAAFNKDKPYNQFLMEQLAGDLMPTDDESLRNERLTATGFLSLGPKVLAEQDKPKMVMDIVDEQIEVTSKAFLGLTVACARCHDHKFDPIPTKDYYALAGMFKSTRVMQDLGFVSRIYERPLMTHELQMAVEASDKQIERLKAARDAETDRANQALLATFHKDAGKYLLAGWELSRQPVTGLQSVAELPMQPGDPKRLILEAENFQRGTVSKNFDSYGKGIGIIETPSVPAFAEWDINLPTAGNYQLELRYASEQSRPVKLTLNGKTIREKAAGKATGSFFPDGQRWEAIGVFAFQAGKNTLRLDTADGPIPHFDKLLIVPMKPSASDAQGKPARTSEEIAEQYGLNEAELQKWAYALPRAAKDPVFGAWVAFASLPTEGFASQADALAQRVAQGAGLPVAPSPAVARFFADFHPTRLQDVADRYARLFAQAESAWQAAKQADPRASKLADADLETIRAKLYDTSGVSAPIEKPERFYSEASKAAIKKADEAIKMAEAQKPKVPMALAVEDAHTIADCRVHIRGSTLTLGDVAPRHFLRVVAGDDQKPIDTQRSGRLELAEWLARPDHPLTARVEVNRIWEGHFGEGIVRTLDNFGFMGDRPDHPELLDWLAASFVEKGWSIKRMHRLMMLSSAYQMSSAYDPKADLADPEDRLLWRMPRRRLDAEPFRDAILAVAGTLDTTMGGTLLTTGDNDYVTNDQSADAARYGSLRRSVYLPIIRNALFDMFQAFDYGDPSMTHAYRPTTTVAPQALWVMNSPFALDQARHFATALLTNAKATDSERVKTAYLKAFSRPPTPTETQRALGYIALYESHLAGTEPDSQKRHLKAWQSFCQILFASNEFIYVN